MPDGCLMGPGRSVGQPGLPVPAVPGRSPVTRRSVLRGAAAAAAATTLGGCSRAGQLEMAVVWSGSELARFRALLDKIGQTNVLVTSGGDFMHTFLSDRARANRLPHVAILSSPGLLPEYVSRGWLLPLTAQPGDPPEASPFGAWPPQWAGWLTVADVPYGAWVKAAHKSLFWCRPERAAQLAEDWKALIAKAARGEDPEPGALALAIGAADSWVLTDWFENLLTTGEYADILADDWNVRRPLTVLGRIWRAVRFPGGARRALLTQFDASVLQVVTGQADAVFEGDFVQALGNDRPGRRDIADVAGLTPFRFPSPEPAGQLVVGGDFVVMFNRRCDGSRSPDQSDASRLAGLLAGRAAQLQWAQFPGYLSPRTDIAAAEYAQLPIDEATDSTVLHALSTSQNVRFDLSDQLRPDRGRALGDMLQNFFRRVTQPGSDLGTCVDDAVGELHRHVSTAPSGADDETCELPDAVR